MLKSIIEIGLGIVCEALKIVYYITKTKFLYNIFLKMSPKILYICTNSKTMYIKKYHWLSFTIIF